MNIRHAIMLIGFPLVAAWAQPPPAEIGLQEPPIESLHPADLPGDGGRPPPPPPVQQLMQRWQRTNPEEYARMRKLRDEDPAAFRRALHQRLLEKRKEHGFKDGNPGFGSPGRDLGSPEARARERRIQDLAEAWRLSTNEMDRAQLKTELKSELSTAFDEREQARRRQMEQMEERLQKLQEHLEQRKTQRDAIIERRLNDLTTGADLSW